MSFWALWWLLSWMFMESFCEIFASLYPECCRFFIDAKFCFFDLIVLLNVSWQPFCFTAAKSRFASPIFRWPAETVHYWRPSAMCAVSLVLVSFGRFLDHVSFFLCVFSSTLIHVSKPINRALVLCSQVLKIISLILISSVNACQIQPYDVDKTSLPTQTVSYRRLRLKFRLRCTWPQEQHFK